MAAEQTDLAARPESMSKADAKRLTAQIRRQLGDVQQRSERLAEMVRRAHRENAWAALGYATWDQWLAAEFPDLTRGQKYRLVAWGEVVGELEAAAQAPVEVSGRQAAKAKKAGTSTVAEKVRQRLASIPEPTDDDRRGAVADALAEPIEATGTKVEPSPAAVPEPPPQEPAARARAATETVVAPVPGTEASHAAPTPAATAGELVAQLRAIEPATAAETVRPEALDELMAWVGLVRVAIRRRGDTAKPPAPPKAAPAAKAAPAPAPPKAAPSVKAAAPVSAAVKAPAKERAGVDAKPADCAHPANRIMGGTCFACGAKVGK